MHVDAIPLRLKIDDFRVIAVDERDEVVEVVIETVHPNTCCPDCGHADAVAKERRQLIVRDIPLRPGKQTWLLWWKPRFVLRERVHLLGYPPELGLCASANECRRPSRREHRAVEPLME